MDVATTARLAEPPIATAPATSATPATSAISAKVLTVGELFSGAYRFRLPWFQRAYAWQTVQVARLLGSIVGAMNGAKGAYPLGTLVLANDGGSAETALIDGHQRIMTLTILFAVLRDLERRPEEAWRLDRFIAAPPGANGDDVRQYRLVAQPALAPFVENVVQSFGATESPAGDDCVSLSETERNVLENRDFLRLKLGDETFDAKSRRALAEFIADRCILIVHVLKDEDEAWRMLEVDEETRLDFNRADHAKASILAVIPPADRDDCGRLWEQCEHLIGPTDTYLLLSHLRLRKMRRRSDKPIEAEICRRFAIDTAGRAFMEQELLPAARRVHAIRNGCVGEGRARGEVDQSLQHVAWIERNVWIPAAIQWLDSGREGEASTPHFFRRLECLVWMMRLSATDTAKQEHRMIALISEIERRVPVDEMDALKIERAMKLEALRTLRHENFCRRPYAGQVLRRISVVLGGDPGPVDRDKVTIEHILPRNPWPNRSWRRSFASKRRVESYANRLGNLTFLTGIENQLAGTLDWPEKQSILAHSSFPLSRRAAAVRDWTAKAIEQRTDDLIRILFSAWDLEV